MSRPCRPASHLLHKPTSWPACCPLLPGDVRAQEEMLRKVQAMADTLDYEALKKAVLPAVHTLCLGTTSGEPRGTVRLVYA